MNNAPSGEKILSLLIDLLAEQNGVKVKYQIVKKGDKKHEKAS